MCKSTMKTLLIITILTVHVIVIMVMCLLNESGQNIMLNQAMNYLRKSNVMQNVFRKDLNVVSNDSVVKLHQPETSRVSTVQSETSHISNVNKHFSRLMNINCRCSCTNFKTFLLPLIKRLVPDDKTKNVNSIVEPPVKAVRERNCSSLSYVSPAGPLTALASYPGSGNTWARHIIQQATGGY